VERQSGEPMAGRFCIGIERRSGRFGWKDPHSLTIRSTGTIVFDFAPMGLYSSARPLVVNRDGARIYYLQSAEQPQSGVIQVRTGAIH
jgi:hypothetical protein